MRQVLAGSELTGPSLNPAVTFAWAAHHRGHTLLEHLVVFWVAPLAGGTDCAIDHHARTHMHARTHARRHVQRERGTGTEQFQAQILAVVSPTA